MPIELHERCVARLKERLAEVIPEFRVLNGSFLERASLRNVVEIESSLPDSRELRETFEHYINENPFSDFVYAVLTREIYEEQEFDQDGAPISITDIPEYADAVAVADRLVNAFVSLPLMYRYTFQLSPKISQFIEADSIQLAEHIFIRRPTEQFKQQFPLQTGNLQRDGLMSAGGLLGLASRWADDAAYIQIELSGFAGLFILSNTTRSSIDLLKSIYGIGLAVRALEIGFSMSPSVKQRGFVHLQSGEDWEPIESFELDLTMSEVIDELKVDNLNDGLPDDQLPGWLENRANFISRALSHPEITNRLLLAGRWLFDSYCGSNELLSFVQTMVALEILLGDKAASDRVGLGELLSNRCAYLVGKTHDQRNEILNDFHKIYDIRSRIVHRGKERLNKGERMLFYRLQWLVKRVIQEEIERIESND